MTLSGTGMRQHHEQIKNHAYEAGVATMRSATQPLKKPEQHVYAHAAQVHSHLADAHAALASGDHHNAAAHVKKAQQHADAAHKAAQGHTLSEHAHGTANGGLHTAVGLVHRLLPKEHQFAKAVTASIGVPDRFQSMAVSYHRSH